MAKKRRQKQHFIYIIKSKDDRLYTGYTTDLERRLREHQTGKGAKFTRAFGALAILYHEVFATKSAAMKRESQIKSLPRIKKIKLIQVAVNNHLAENISDQKATGR